MDKSKYEGIFTCGFCRKKTVVSDKQVECIMGEGLLEPFAGICSCGHHSYASTMRAKFKQDFSSWRYVYGKR